MRQPPATDVPAGQSRRRWMLALWLYLALLHGVGAGLLIKSNALLLLGKTLGWLPPEEWSEGYYQAVLAQAALGRTAPSGATVLIGDSIIVQLDAARIGPDVLNYGLSGDTTRTLRARIPTLGVLTAPHRVVIGIGVNDLKYREPAAIAPDAAAVLAALPHGVALILLSPLPVDEAGTAAGARSFLRNARIRALADTMRGVCAAWPECRFLDVWPAFTAPLQPPLYGPDGWHLSAAGNAVLADLIAASLR